MKEEITNPLEQAFADMLTRIVNGMEKGADFLSSQLPAVVEQLLTWKLYESIIGCVMGLLLVAFCLKTPFWAYKKYKKSDEGWDEFCVELASVFGGSALFVMFVGGLYMINLKWLQIWIAPKIYLIEYAAELIK